MATDNKIPVNDEVWQAAAYAAITGILARSEHYPDPASLVANAAAIADEMVACHAAQPAKQAAAQKELDEQVKADAEAKKAADESKKASVANPRCGSGGF